MCTDADLELIRIVMDPNFIEVLAIDGSTRHEALLKELIP